MSNDKIASKIARDFINGNRSDAKGALARDDNGNPRDPLQAAAIALATFEKLRGQHGKQEALSFCHYIRAVAW